MSRRTKIAVLLTVDMVLINLSYVLALIIRFEGNILGNQFISYFIIYKDAIIHITLIKLFIFSFFSMYKSSWRYASIEELANVIASSIMSNLAVFTYMYLMDTQLPRSIYIIATLLDMLFIGGIRFSYRSLDRKSVV